MQTHIVRSALPAFQNLTKTLWENCRQIFTINISTNILHKILANKFKPYIIGIETGKEEIKLSVSADDIIVYKIPSNSTKTKHYLNEWV